MKKHILLLSLLLCQACTLQQPVQNTDIPDSDNGPIPVRVGVSTSTTWFWLWETGDSSVDKAQQNGGITDISSVTKSTRTFLGIVKKHTTTVRGK